MSSIVALKLDRKSHMGVVTLCDVVIVGFLAYQSIYSSPIPAISTVSNHLSAFRNAITKYGTKGDRGSHRDYIALLAAREVVCKDLTQLANYAESITPRDRVSLSKIGWVLKGTGKRIGKLPPVQDLRQADGGAISLGTLKLLWDKPFGTKDIRVNIYRVMRSETSSFADAKDVGITSSTSFIDKNPGNGWRYYWVIPVNAYGNGAQSDLCMAIAKPVSA